jgi:hypothetical protein
MEEKEVQGGVQVVEVGGSGEEGLVDELCCPLPRAPFI